MYFWNVVYALAAMVAAHLLVLFRHPHATLWYRLPRTAAVGAVLAVVFHVGAIFIRFLSR